MVTVNPSKEQRVSVISNYPHEMMSGGGCQDNIKKLTKKAQPNDTAKKNTSKKDCAHSEVPLPESIPQTLPPVGSRIGIYWPDDATFYPATVSTARSKRGSKIRVDYDDGEFEMLHLKKEAWHYLDTSSPPEPVSEASPKKQHVPFISHCARDTAAGRLAAHGPLGLTVAEIRAALEPLLPSLPPGVAVLPPRGARKSVQAEALRAALEYTKGSGGHLPPPSVSAEDAAREKAAAGEHRGVEHVAELSAGQAIKATGVGSVKKKKIKTTRIKTEMKQSVCKPCAVVVTPVNSTEGEVVHPVSQNAQIF